MEDMLLSYIDNVEDKNKIKNYLNTLDNKEKSFRNSYGSFKIFF